MTDIDTAIQAKLDQISQGSAYEHYRPLTEAANEFISWAKTPELRVYTGIAELDAAMRGTAPGELTLVQGFCMTMDHEVLTPFGFRSQWELSIGDPIWTMNKETQEGEWQPITDITLVRHEGEIHNISGRNINASVTPNHRWAVHSQHDQRLKVKRTDELNTSDHIPLARPKKTTGNSWSDEWVELLGWVFCEGHYEATGGGVVIYQSHLVNPSNCARIEACLGVLGLKYSVARRIRPNGSSESAYRIAAADAACIRKQFPDKMATVEFIDELSARQCSLLVDVMVLADGYVANGNGHRRMLTTRRAEADILPILLAQAGVPFSTKERFQVTKFGTCVAYEFNVKKRRDTRVARNKTTIEPYSGMVWCPTVDNGVIFVRRGDVTFWTHNTHSGKTLVMTEMMLNNPDTPIVLFTPDETRPLVLTKLTSARHGVDVRHLEQRIHADDHEARMLLMETAEKYGKLAIFDESVSVVDMDNMMDEAAHAFGQRPKGVIFDYAELLEGSDDVKSKMTALKAWGKRQHVSLFVVHQASRTSGSGGRKMTIDSGSYGGEQQATHVIGVRRKKYMHMAMLAILDEKIANATNPKSIEEYHRRKDEIIKVELPRDKDTLTISLVKNKRPPCELVDDLDYLIEPDTGRVVRIESSRDEYGNEVRVRKSVGMEWLAQRHEQKLVQQAMNEMEEF